MSMGTIDNELAFPKQNIPWNLLGFKKLRQKMLKQFLTTYIT